MIGGDIPLNINFVLSKLLLGAAAVLHELWRMLDFHRDYYNGILNHVH